MFLLKRIIRGFKGEIVYNDKDLTELDAHERAREGMFLAFQYPVEITGISNIHF